VFGSIGGKAGCLAVDRDGRDAPRAGPQPRVRVFPINHPGHGVILEV
jgi:hypothetical protein